MGTPEKRRPQTQVVPKMPLDRREDLVLRKGESSLVAPRRSRATPRTPQTDPGRMNDSSDRCTSPALKVKSKLLPTAHKFPCGLHPPALPATSLWLTPLQPHQPSRCSSSSPNLLPPQDLCTCFPCLECSSSGYQKAPSLASFACGLRYHLLRDTAPDHSAVTARTPPPPLFNSLTLLL